MLEKLRVLFLSASQIRQRIDIATYITISTLKAIEGKLSVLGDDVREDIETIKARTARLGYCRKNQSRNEGAEERDALDR